MSAFAIAFSADENDSGLVTFYDISNWSSNDEGYQKSDFVRSIQIQDAYGTNIVVITFDPNSLDVTYQLTKNQWVVATFNIVGVQNYTKTLKFNFQRLFEVSFNNALLAHCGCGCIGKIPNLCEIIAFYIGASFAVPIGDGVSFQIDIDTSYTLLG